MRNWKSTLIKLGVMVVLVLGSIQPKMAYGMIVFNRGEYRITTPQEKTNNEIYRLIALLSTHPQALIKELRNRGIEDPAMQARIWDILEDKQQAYLQLTKMAQKLGDKGYETKHYSEAAGPKLSVCDFVTGRFLWWNYSGYRCSKPMYHAVTRWSESTKTLNSYELKAAQMAKEIADSIQAIYMAFGRQDDILIKLIGKDYDIPSKILTSFIFMV